MIAILKFFIDYIAAPILTWGAGLYAALDWVGRAEEVGRSLLAGIVMLLILSAYAYQTGYKGFYLGGSKRYYVFVFLLPILVGAVGISVGYVLTHW